MRKNMADIAPRKISITTGKADFHNYKLLSGKVVSPCICENNIDFSEGCIANVNPYFRNADEILADINGKKNILNKDREEIFARLDEILESEKKQLNPQLNPNIRYTKNFPDSLKEKIWKILVEHVLSLQKRFPNGISEIGKPLSGFFDSGIGLLDGRAIGCEYCYAKPHNNAQNILVDVNFSDVKKELEEMIARKEFVIDTKGKNRIFLRKGKWTECDSIVHLNSSLELLKIADEYDANVLIPTKFLYFDKTLADYCVKTGSSIQYGVCVYPNLEKGPILWGFDYEYRLECAKRYANAGVSVGLKISADCDSSFDSCMQRGGIITKLIDFIDSTKSTNNPIFAQIIPLRIKSNALVRKVTGHSRKELLSGVQNLFGNSVEAASYIADGQNALIPFIIHPDYKNYFNGNICGQVGEHFYCNSCHFSDMPCNWKVEERLKIPVEYDNEKRKGKKKEVEQDPNLPSFLTELLKA